MPSLPISRASSSTRGRLSVSVSSSKKNSLTCGKRLLRVFQFVDDVTDAAGAVGVPADGLRPQAEGAARFAAAPGVKRQIRVPQIADEVVLDLEVALVDRRDERQLVHVVQQRALVVVDDAAVVPAIRQTGDAAEVAALGDLLDREVELLARDEIELARRPAAACRLDRDLRADHADLQAWVGRPSAPGGLDVGRKTTASRCAAPRVAVLRPPAARRRATAGAAARRSAWSPRPWPPAAPARSGTRTT